jgi:hypothetical protein
MYFPSTTALGHSGEGREPGQQRSIHQLRIEYLSLAAGRTTIDITHCLRSRWGEERYSARRRSWSVYRRATHRPHRRHYFFGPPFSGVRSLGAFSTQDFLGKRGGMLELWPPGLGAARF